jgi:3-hydroxybutyryl-CoA dehydrogenase
MKIACIGTEAQQQEWNVRAEQRAAPHPDAKEGTVSFTVEWLMHPTALTDQQVCFDFLADEDHSHQAPLVAFQQKGGLVVVNAVLQTSESLPTDFARINAWPGFLANPRLEMVCKNNDIQKQLTNVVNACGRTAEWVPDQVGFLAPRVICSIINEAYLTLSEGVSDKNQIDIAMQLGTNYPMGPFAWAEKIGKKRVVALLKKLSSESSRYTPASLLEEEANVN